MRCGRTDSSRPRTSSRPARRPRRPCRGVAQLNDMQPDAGDAPPASPDFVSRQGYLATAPVGVDAMFAWTLPGGERRTGQDHRLRVGVAVHARGSAAEPGRGRRRNEQRRHQSRHGRARCDQRRPQRHRHHRASRPTRRSARRRSATSRRRQAIKAAADKLGAGDIILLEIHRPGPAAPNPLQGQLGFIAIEWWPDDFAAIRYAVAKGIIVVEAAGNGFAEPRRRPSTTRRRPGSRRAGRTRSTPATRRRVQWSSARARRRRARMAATTARTARGSTSRTSAPGWTSRAGAARSRRPATAICRADRTRTSGTPTSSPGRRARRRSSSARSPPRRARCAPAATAS